MYDTITDPIGLITYVRHIISKLWNFFCLFNVRYSTPNNVEVIQQIFIQQIFLEFLTPKNR